MLCSAFFKRLLTFILCICVSGCMTMQSPSYASDNQKAREHIQVGDQLVIEVLADNEQQNNSPYKLTVIVKENNANQLVTDKGNFEWRQIRVLKVNQVSMLRTGGVFLAILAIAAGIELAALAL